MINTKVFYNFASSLNKFCLTNRPTVLTKLVKSDLSSHEAAALLLKINLEIYFKIN